MTTSDVILPPAAPIPAARWPRWSVALTVAGAIVMVLAVVASRVNLSYYVLVPGVAQPVQPMLTVPAGLEHPLHGKVLLTDVGIGQVSALNYLFDTFNNNVQLVPTGELLGGVPPSEFNAEGTVQMTESQLTAVAVAERQLGMPVPENDSGVVIYATSPGTGAFQSLQVGQVITAVDGVPTPDLPSLVAAVRTHAPGTIVHVAIGSMTAPTASRTVDVKLAQTREHGQSVTILGVVGYDQPAYQVPFPVHIASNGIGGPSAGLAFTLGILDSVSGGGLTGGRVIAATGTIHPDGSIGAVGGIPQKTIAVENAGAKVFLVPASEARQATTKVRDGLVVLPVSTLSQAIADLVRLGGHAGSAASGPVQGPDGHSAPVDWNTTPWA